MEELTLKRRKITLSEVGEGLENGGRYLYVSRGNTKLSEVKCDDLNFLEVECKTPAENGGSGESR